MPAELRYSSKMISSLNRFKQTVWVACKEFYAETLVSLAVYGSWARGTATQESDIDMLIIVSDLPPSRGKRMRQFEAIDAVTLDSRKAVWGPTSPAPEISPLIKTPTEVEAGSPLFLDMTDWRDILFDRDDYLQRYLAALKERMRVNGTERRMAKGGYYWVYKPNLQPGEVVTL